MVVIRKEIQIMADTNAKKERKDMEEVMDKEYMIKWEMEENDEGADMHELFNEFLMECGYTKEEIENR